MARLAITSLVFVLTLALSVWAGPVPQDMVSSTLTAPAATSTAAAEDALPSLAFTFGPRPASDPLPSQTPGTPAKLEMDWLS
ncbi:hypothetical protein TRAPUB_12691 [Trametes pubescens]|uniref:Uncharacterized protein n=1 Tax=Trametes pubescens TaxID=154538 RepID=A0A1M2VTI1_TRAPU|nr:hypothetical protein TRAPUB_12691 [Trametes pubescens]